MTLIQTKHFSSYSESTGVDQISSLSLALPETAIQFIFPGLHIRFKNHMHGNIKTVAEVDIQTSLTQ